MTRLHTGLSAGNMGEWLASLGLLRAAASIDAESRLSFSHAGEALLETAVSEQALVQKVIASAHPASIAVEYLSRVENPTHLSVRVGDDLYERTSHTLAEEKFAGGFNKNEDSKVGCLFRLSELGGLTISHYSGKAQSEEAGLKSSLILWAGMVTFQGILRNISAKVSSARDGSSFADFCAVASRETQRFRFDHRDEQFEDDGAHDSSSGRTCRPAIEWLALLGLSFFPAAAGFESLSPQRRHVVSRIWSNPLSPQATLLALHSGQAITHRIFFAASDGKMKKLRSITQSK